MFRRHGRREWYKLSGYTKRSMVENAVYRYKAIIGPEMRELERWRGNELNTELGASQYSTRWLRSGCPIRTAPGDSATGTGRSAICSGPCNNARRAINKDERRPTLGGVSERQAPCGQPSPHRRKNCVSRNQARTASTRAGYAAPKPAAVSRNGGVQRSGELLPKSDILES